MEKMRAIDIKEKFDDGEITPEEAVNMFQSLNRSRGLSLPYSYSIDEAYISRVERGKYYKDKIAAPLYSIVGGLLGLVDSVAYGTSEAVEEATFAVTRVVKRGVDGVKRGLQ